MKKYRECRGNGCGDARGNLAPRRALCTFDGRKSVIGTKELLLTRVTEPCILVVCKHTTSIQGGYFMKKSISHVQGKGSLAHNNREFITNNVDRNRAEGNSPESSPGGTKESRGGKS